MFSLRNVLVATDFSEPAKVALRYGVEFAKRFDAQLHLLHVVDDIAAHPYAAIPIPVDLGQWQMDLEAGARASLSALLPETERAKVRARLEIIVSTSPAHAVLSYARDANVDLIIVGTHGRHGMSKLLMGSVAQQISGGADCPVLTVRAPERDFVTQDAVATSAARSGSTGEDRRL